MSGRSLVVCAAVIVAAALTMFPVDLVLRPILLILVLMASFSTMLLGMREPTTGKVIGASLFCAAFASSWAPGAAALREVLLEYASRPGVIAAVVVLLLLAAVLVVAKMMVMRPPPAKLPKPMARRRERDVEPVNAEDVVHVELATDGDDLHLFSDDK